MSRMQARKVEQRIHLDTRIKVFVYGGTRSTVTGRRALSASPVVWAALESGESALMVGPDSSLALAKDRIVVRWDSRFSRLDADVDVRVSMDPDLPDADAADAQPVTSIVRIGRRRFLALELGT